MTRVGTYSWLLIGPWRCITWNDCAFMRLDFLFFFTLYFHSQRHHYFSYLFLLSLLSFLSFWFSFLMSYFHLLHLHCIRSGISERRTSSIVYRKTPSQQGDRNGLSNHQSRHRHQASEAHTAQQRWPPTWVLCCGWPLRYCGVHDMMQARTSTGLMGHSL